MTDTTQAAEPITSATEPAACEDETQSVYAWSSSEGDDTEIIQRRSWKLPLAAVMLAAAGLAAGITVWPHHSTLGSPAAPPQAAPHSTAPAAAAAQPADPDAHFFALLANGGYRLSKPGDKQEAIVSGHEVCRARHDGNDADWILQHWIDTNPQSTPDTMRLFVYSAFDAYCPNG